MRSACCFDLDNTLTHRQKSIEQYSIHFAAHFRHLLSQCSHEEISGIISAVDCGGYLPKHSPFQSVKAAIAEELTRQLPWRHLPSNDTLVEHWRIHFPASAEAMPGVHETFRALRRNGFGIGIVSNGSVESRRRTIEKLSLGEQLDLVICSEEVSIKKPDPRIFAIACQRLGVEASAIWFVGDHPVNDIIGAHRAGFKAIWLKGFHKWPASFPKPKWEIDSLNEVLDIIPLY